MKPSSYTTHRVATDDRAFREIVETTRSAPNGEVSDLEITLDAYERKFGMSSADAKAALSRGELRPTQEVEGWMAALRVRDHLAKARTR